MKVKCQITEFKPSQIKGGASAIKLLFKFNDVVKIFNDNIFEKIFYIEVNNKKYKAVFNPTSNDVIGNVLYNGEFILSCRLLVYNADDFVVTNNIYFIYQ